MSDAVIKILAEADFTLLEGGKSMAKKLLKSDKMAQGKNERGRGIRAYLRAVASGRDASYLLTQKGKIGEGAKYAKKLLGEDLAEAKKRMFPRGLAKGALGVTGQAILNIIRPHGSLSESKILSAMKKAHGLSFMSTKGHKTWLKKLEGMGRLTKKGSTWSIKSSVTEAKDPIGKSKNASKFRWLAGQIKVGQRQHSTNRPDNHDGIAPSFLKKMQRLGYIKIVSSAHGETDWKLLKELPSAMNEDFTASELDSWWAGARPKLVRGSRATRHSRMAGCVKSLRALRDGGIKVSGLSQTDKNPVPRKERDSEDQPVDSTPGKVDEDITIEETPMNLNDAIARFRSLDEANIPAPSVSRTQPGGGNQFSSKSKFKYYGGADQDYTGDSISIPADAEAKAAMSHSSNVKGPVGADAREVVDVRIEDIDADQLVAMLEQIAESADTLEEYAQLIETHLGFDMVCQAFKLSENVENPELLLGRIYEGVTNPVQQGNGPVVNNPHGVHDDPMSEANRGVSTDDFVENSTDAEDHAFAQGMMRGETTDAGLSVAEAAIPAPDPQQTGPAGKQIASKSRFRKYYPGPGQTNTGDPAPIPADPETHAAMSHSAGAGGPGYTADKREETDVRVESMRRSGMQFQPQGNGQRPPEPSTTNELDAFAASMSYPTDLIQK